MPNLLVNIPGEEGSDVGDDVDDEGKAVRRQVATDVGSCNYVSTRQHTQHTSAYVRQRQQTKGNTSGGRLRQTVQLPTSARYS